MGFASRKHTAELRYWKARRREAPLEAGAEWYAWTFTEHFGVDCRGRHMLDVGCGPRGSLEWAADAARRVGLDPLADRYRRLHSAPHGAEYVAAAAEAMPFADGEFDLVSCFNALDHVDDVVAAVGELGRVTRAGGRLLLVVDVDHDSTPTEPHRLGWDLLDRFAPAWDVDSRGDYERPAGNMLANLRAAVPFDHDDATDRPGVLSAALARTGSPPGAPGSGR